MNQPETDRPLVFGTHGLHPRTHPGTGGLAPPRAQQAGLSFRLIAPVPIENIKLTFFARQAGLRRMMVMPFSLVYGMKGAKEAVVSMIERTEMASSASALERPVGGRRTGVQLR